MWFGAPGFLLSAALQLGNWVRASVTQKEHLPSGLEISGLPIRTITEKKKRWGGETYCAKQMAVLAEALLC